MRFCRLRLFETPATETSVSKWNVVLIWAASGSLKHRRLKQVTTLGTENASARLRLFETPATETVDDDDLEPVLFPPQAL